MAEQQDTGFKITDRRKFNADGSPRETDEPKAAPNAAAAEGQPRTTEAATGNVVSFPGEAAKRQPEPSPSDRPGATAGRAAEPVPSGASTAAGRAEQAYEEARPKSSGLPEASFLSLVNMLGVEAAMHLGLIQSPGEEAPPPDAEAARHLIDMLGMLQSKTRGNLTAEEDSLLENVLADLRMQFVAMSRRR